MDPPVRGLAAVSLSCDKVVWLLRVSRSVGRSRAVRLCCRLDHAFFTWRAVCSVVTHCPFQIECTH